MLMTMVFWPLLFLSSWAILPAIYIIPFVFLHLPVQILKGRWLCCRCCLCCYEKSDLAKLDDEEKEELVEYYFGKFDDLSDEEKDGNN